MYWIAKVFQASGLVVMGWGFFKSYPGMMPRNIILLAGVFFIIGWIIQAYMLKR